MLNYALYSMVEGNWMRVSDFYKTEQEAHDYANELKLHHHSGCVYYDGGGHLFMVESR